jgi:hypothetical protein
MGARRVHAEIHVTRRRWRSSIVLALCVLAGARVAADPPRAQAPDAPAALPKPRSETAQNAEAKTQAEAVSVENARRALWRTLRHELATPAALPTAVREELRRYAQRVARLQRIRELCAQKKDQAAMLRADKLLQREQERHRVVLARLWPASSTRAARRAARAAARQRAEEEEEEGEPDPEAEEEPEGQP